MLDDARVDTIKLINIYMFRYRCSENSLIKSNFLRLTVYLLQYNILELNTQRHQFVIISQLCEHSRMRAHLNAKT